MRRILLTVLFSLLCVTGLLAQTLKVSGQVTDVSGEPMIGISILEKGTTNGVITDFDGNYSISMKKGGTLVFSYVGYVNQEIQPAGSVLNVTMKEDTQVLDELIVVGYGVQKKSSVTGSISKVDSEQMMNRSITSAQDALGGKTAGVQMVSSGGAPGEAATIRIRGYASNYTSDPLYIVDGLKMSDISNIDANDIESIEVLKDAASAAIYGAEAGNGVILVTTKKGKTGTMKISYDFQYAATSLAHLPDLMNAKEYETWYRESGYITDETMRLYYDGVTDNNWAKSATETGAMQKHTLSFQSGTEKSQVYLSLNYLDNDSFLKGKYDTHQRYNFTMNAELKVKDWLTVGGNARVSYQKMNTNPIDSSTGSGGGPFAMLLQIDPMTPTYFDADNLPEFVQNLQDEGRKYPQASNGDYFGASRFSTSTNPLMNVALNHYQMTNKDVNATFFVNITPFKGFVFTSRLGANLVDTRTHTYSETYYVTANMSNDNPTVSESAPSSVYYQWENFANYNVTLGGKHDLGAMAGFSFSRTVSNSLSASVNKLSKELPNFTYLSYATSDATRTLSGEKQTMAKLSYFGRLNYAYDNKYMAEFTLRADAADLSVLSKSQRWGYFPAVSLGWIASNEPWFKKSNAFTYAKLRASWGENGSISNLSNFMYASAIDSSGFYSFTGANSYSVGSMPTTLGNDNLKWETSEQLDFGLDLRFLNDRLSFSADYFVKKTKDLLISGSTPSLTAGNDPSPINAGNVENKGVELELTWKDRIGKDFTYSISANVGTLKNKVTYLDPTIARLEGANAVGNNVFTYFEVGQPIWYLRGYKFKGVNAQSGDPEFYDLNGDGEITAADKEYIGSGIPDFTYGITINAAYKGLDLTIFGSGSQGNDIFCNLNNIYNTGDNHLKLYYDDRWTSTNTTASHPRPGCNYSREYYMSDANVFNGSYFKIKQIQLGYTLPKSLLKKISFENIRAYVSLDDFFTFTSYPGIDPETSSSNTTNGMGIDSAGYPSSKKVVFGFNVTF